MSNESFSVIPPSHELFESINGATERAKIRRKTDYQALVEAYNQAPAGSVVMVGEDIRKSNLALALRSRGLEPESDCAIRKIAVDGNKVVVIKKISAKTMSE